MASANGAMSRQAASFLVKQTQEHSTTEAVRMLDRVVLPDKGPQAVEDLLRASNMASREVVSKRRGYAGRAETHGPDYEVDLRDSAALHATSKSEQVSHPVLYKGKPVITQVQRGNSHVQFLPPSSETLEQLRKLPLDEQVLHEYVKDLPYTSELRQVKQEQLARSEMILRLKTITRLGRDDPTFLCCKMCKIGLSDQWGLHLAKALCYNKTLEALFLNENLLSGESIVPLVRSIENHPRLRELSMGANDMGNSSAWAVGLLLQRNQVIQTINLAAAKRAQKVGRFETTRIRIDHTGVEAIANGLSKNTTLLRLNLSFQNVGDAGANALGVALSTNDVLMSLVLKHTGVSASGAAALAFALSQNSALRELDLSANGIGDESARKFSSALSQNSSLRVLDLSSTLLKPKGCSLLEKVLARHPSLTAVYMFGNNVGPRGKKVEKIAARSGKLTTHKLVKEPDGPRSCALPIRFHSSGFKDSKTNMLHLRVATPSGLESFVDVESAYDRSRAERRAVGNTLRHQKSKQHEMLIHRFTTNRYAPNAPPPSFALSIPDYVDRKYPHGIDRRNPMPSKTMAASTAPGWRDESVALIHSLSQKLA